MFAFGTPLTLHTCTVVKPPEELSDFLFGGRFVGQGLPKDMRFFIIDTIQKIHGMKCLAGQNDAESCLQAGCSSSGESNANNFQPIGSIFFLRAGGEQDLLEIMRKSDLANTPLLRI